MHTQRSLSAELEFQAHRCNSQVRTKLIGLPGEPDGTIHISERLVRGWRLGIHDGAVLLSAAASSTQTRLLLDAVATALTDADVVTLRIVGPAIPAQVSDSSPDGRPAAEPIGQLFNIREVMPLAATFEGFLRGLGKHTRRNMRHLRDEAQRNGIKFRFTNAESFIDRSRLSNLAKFNDPIQTNPRKLLSMIQLLEAQPLPFQAHLSQLVDQPFSVAGGFIEGDLALMIYQINNRVFRSSSPSLMLRSFLVQALIERGIRYLAFVGGCAGPLYHQCAAVPAVAALIMRRTPMARAKHLASRMIANPTDRLRQLTPQLITLLCAVGYPLTASLASACA